MPIGKINAVDDGYLRDRGVNKQCANERADCFTFPLRQEQITNTDMFLQAAQSNRGS